MRVLPWFPVSYYVLVSLVRLLGIGLYIGYLVQVGLLMIVLPWSNVWGLLMTRISPGASWLLDAPAVRGALTAFGVVHLAMVVLELVAAGDRDRRHRHVAAPTRETSAQDRHQS